MLGSNKHVLGQRVEVCLLLGQLLLQLEELLLLALADGVVLRRALALLEGVAVKRGRGVSAGRSNGTGAQRHSGTGGGTLTPGRSWGGRRCRRQPCGWPTWQRCG